MPIAFLIWERHRLREELSEREVERLYASQDPSAFAGVADAAASSSGGAGASAGGKKQQQQGAAAAAAAAAATEATAAAAAGGGIGDFQRKITPEALLAELGPGAGGAAGAAADGEGGGGGLAGLLLEGEDEAGNWKAASASASRRHDILLVASLIDKVPNLAGLARTCEVLGAGRLVLVDTAVAKDPLWLPMEEVKPAALLAWLERKAAEGYTLVGLEQTAESVRLPDYQWPERAVLVLGREKEGIPPEVLSLLDAALEVPQRGIIRSLNVHVTGAIAL
ncbi:hypothetical protein HYH02_002878 [Chlamydomonas schloesseri]|uniref:tRNA/rRNA methyltransferase SpoU type domain-containing protein n=1 Tax=Chlamydomonas schloesseri TaxID=2026947 RepID=A0A836BB38_9CHLO|nr:hypothetical protein HYH02_002878 [Chlamydomonas schloesseri]|eukprot:KAG2452645.1 hypothetical protein HYH02_002878 [Chlamydomonas schloesseri]